MRKNVTWWLAVAAFLLLALPAGVTFLLATRPGEAMVRRVVERRLESMLGRPVGIGRLRTNLFTTIRLWDLHLGGAGADPPELRVGLARLQYNLWPLLLHGRVQVDLLELLDLDLSTAARADTPLPVPAPGGAPPALALAIPAGFPPLPVRIERLALASAILHTPSGELRLAEGEIGPVVADPGLLSVQRLRLRLPDAELTGQASARREGDRALLQGRLELIGDPLPVLADLGLPLRGRLSLGGQLKLTVDLGGELSAPQAEVRGILPPLEAAGLALLGGELQAGWSPAGLQLRSLELRAAGGSLRATGALRPGPWRVEGLQVALRQLDLAGLWPVFHGAASPFLGKVEADFTASGPLASAPPAAAASPEAQPSLGVRSPSAQSPRAQSWPEMQSIEGLVRLRGLRYRDKPVSPIALRLSYREGLAAAELRQADSSLSARARLERGAVSGQFSARISDLEPLAALVGLAGAGGRLQAEGSIEGPWSGIAGRLAVTLRQPVYGGVRFEEGSLAARLAGGRIVLDSLQLRQGGLRVEASGELDPRSMRGAVRADLAAGDAAPGRLTASFALPRGGALRLDASGEGLPLDPLSAISPTLPAVGGTLRFTARMHRAAPAGAATAPAPLQAEASWTVSDPRFRELQMGSLEGRLVLAEGRLRVEGLDLRGPGARLQAAATVGLDTRRGRPLLSPASPFNGSLQGENVDLRVLTPFLPPAMRVGGRLNGRMEWSGSLQRPEPRGTLAVSGGSLSLSPEAPSLAGAALQASFQGSTLNLESLTATVQGVPVSLSGTLHAPDFERLRFDLNAALSGWGSLDASGTVAPGQLSVDSRVRSLDLRLAGLFVPALLSLRGTLTGTLAVRGTPAVPQVTGTMVGTGLGYRLPGLAAPLSGGALRLSFEGRRVDVQSLAAQLGKGSVSAGGTLSWGMGGLEQADLNVGLRALSLAKPGVYRVSLRSAELRFHGSGDQYSLEGDVEPGDSRLLQNVQPASVIEFLRSLQRPSRPLPLFLAKTRLNVRLRNADSLWMQNNLGRVRLTAALTVLGTATQPSVAGRVTVQDGYVTFLDRRFSITRGTADFADVARMNPVLDLEARTEVKFYQQLQSVPFAIVLTLTGPLETVEVALSSDPPLSQANIVSLLALGTLRSEGPGGLNEERSTGQVLLERAGELASEQFSRYVGEGAKDLLGLDEFTVTGNLFNLGRDQDNPELTASKQLTDRLELSYSTNLGPFDQHDLSMDYKLSENLSLEGKVNQAGEAEVRLKLGIRLK